ncbi:phage major capsid protein (plasmid) [Piscirickettsia salmonis]|nr:phage major capsid protein [Piscirickettsia salmonis]
MLTPLVAALAKPKKAFLTGDGTGKPNGLLNVAPTGVTAAAPTSITLDNILDLRSSVKAAYRRKASYLMHDSTYGSLLKMKDGNGQYIIQPDFKSGEGIFRKPLFVDRKFFFDERYKKVYSIREGINATSGKIDEQAPSAYAKRALDHRVGFCSELSEVSTFLGSMLNKFEAPVYISVIKINHQVCTNKQNQMFIFLII